MVDSQIRKGDFVILIICIFQLHKSFQFCGSFFFLVVQSPGHVNSLQPPAALQASLSLTVSRRLPKFTSIELVPSNHFILCRPLLLLLQFFPASGSFPMSQLFASVSRFSDSVVFDSLQSHGLRHTSLLCPSSTPTAWSNSCPSSR